MDGDISLISGLNSLGPILGSTPTTDEEMGPFTRAHAHMPPGPNTKG